MNFFAILNNRRGQRHLDQTFDLERAAAMPSSAQSAMPKVVDPWYNLGLVYKRQRRWPGSLYRNLRAAELDPTAKAAWWNAGIAATALGEWELAREAWTAFGIELPPGEVRSAHALGADADPAQPRRQRRGGLVRADRPGAGDHPQCAAASLGLSLRRPATT